MTLVNGRNTIMSMHYDNWDRLVTAVLRREDDRELALASSLDSSSISSLSSFSQLDLDPPRLTLPINSSELTLLRTTWKAFLFPDDKHLLPRMDDMLDLQEIADRLQSEYEKECFQLYCTIIGDVLQERIAILEVDKLNLEDVQRVKYSPTLDGNIKTWIQEIRLIIRGLVTSESYLCKHFLSGSDLVKEECFLETAKDCVMQLLYFGEVVAIGVRSGEKKLFRILDMYEALAHCLPDLRVLFMSENGGDINDMVCSEAKNVLDALGDAVITIVRAFENEVREQASTKPIKNGGIHPLSRYVMNYVKLLVDYSCTFNLMLENPGVEPTIAVRENTGGLDVEITSPFTKIVLALIASLQSNIEKKSQMYKNVGLQNIFLMNNMLYVLQEVGDSELRNFLGDYWARKQLDMIQQCAAQYFLASWVKVLECFRIQRFSVAILKKRLRSFNAYFEDVYRIQTGWTIPNPQVREELRISISQKLILGYRTLLVRYCVKEHVTKYTPEDLEEYLLDLFQGTPRILHRKR